MFDQPAGVGLGWVPDPACLPQNVHQSSSQLATAVETLFATPSLGLTGKLLFIFGESYAGTYIPLLAAQLLKTKGVKVGGIGVGDGWVNPGIQQMTYLFMASSHGLVGGGPQIEQVAMLQKNCEQAILASPPNEPIPSRVNDICNLIEEFIVNVSNCNVYDVRTTGNYDFSFIGKYLNQPAVFRALNLLQNVSSFPWSAGSDAIGQLFAVGEQNSVDNVYSFLWTSEGLPSLIYNGVYDMDCGFWGVDAWMENSAWGKKTSWKDKVRVPWILNGTQVGMTRSTKPVTQVLLANAGHLVPYNIPLIAREMMEQFVFNSSIQNKK